MSPADAAALELALRLDPAPMALHLGPPDSPALRDFLGMGLASMTVVEGIGPEADVLPVLEALMREAAPQVILMGERTEAGECSGMLPYLLARALGRPLLPQAISLEREGARTIAVRQLPGGSRQRIAADGPVLVTAATQGIKPRQSAFGPARRGRIETQIVQAPEDTDRLSWTLSPARQRPPRLRASSNEAAGPGAPLTGLNPREAAEQIHEFLLSRGILPP